jgi:hypothetical protein
VSRLAETPEGWSEVAVVEFDPSVEDFACSLTPGTVYAVTVGEGDSTDRPCLGIADPPSRAVRAPELRSDLLRQSAGDEVDWQYVIQLRAVPTPVGTVVIDVPASGCAAAVSTFGGMARVDPNLLSTLERLASS